MGLFKITLGDYPAAYKPEVHGPYDPAINYGKADTPFDQVKLKELPAWLARRNYTPGAMWSAYTRLLWRTNHKYHMTKRYTGVYIMMVCTWGQIFYFVTNHYKEAPHVLAKYH